MKEITSCSNPAFIANNDHMQPVLVEEILLHRRTQNRPPKMGHNPCLLSRLLGIAIPGFGSFQATVSHAHFRGILPPAFRLVKSSLYASQGAVIRRPFRAARGRVAAQQTTHDIIVKIFIGSQAQHRLLLPACATRQQAVPYSLRIKPGFILPSHRLGLILSLSQIRFDRRGMS